MKHTLTTVILAIALLINSSCINFQRIKDSSSLHNTFEEHYGFSRYEETRKRILEELPVGSTENEVREFCDKNFSGGFRKEHELPQKYIPEDVRDLDYICVRVKYSAIFLIAENWTDIVFFLNENHKLEDVVAQSSGVSL